MAKERMAKSKKDSENSENHCCWKSQALASNKGLKIVLTRTKDNGQVANVNRVLKLRIVVISKLPGETGHRMFRIKNVDRFTSIDRLKLRIREGDPKGLVPPVSQQRLYFNNILLDGSNFLSIIHYGIKNRSTIFLRTTEEPPSENSDSSDDWTTWTN